MEVIAQLAFADGAETVLFIPHALKDGDGRSVGPRPVPQPRFGGLPGSPRTLVSRDFLRGGLPAPRPALLGAGGCIRRLVSSRYRIWPLPVAIVLLPLLHLRGQARLAVLVIWPAILHRSVAPATFDGRPHGRGDSRLAPVVVLPLPLRHLRGTAGIAPLVAAPASLHRRVARLAFDGGRLTHSQGSVLVRGRGKRCW